MRGTELRGAARWEGRHARGRPPGSVYVREVDAVEQLPPSEGVPDFAKFEIHGVSFADIDNGIFVGQRRDSTGTDRGVAVLGEVEIDPSTGDVFAGGECGRVWRWDASSGSWSELKSHTDAHIQGMSFVSTGDGFLAGFRQTTTQQSIVRYRR